MWEGGSRQIGLNIGKHGGRSQKVADRVDHKQGLTGREEVADRVN
jgi:hypothetical protein